MKNSSAKTLQSSLRSANFILLVLGQGISLFGNTMLRFAMSMWVLDETASSTTFATVLAISVIPTILISPFGGVMADRVSKRAMMVARYHLRNRHTARDCVFRTIRIQHSRHRHHAGSVGSTRCHGNSRRAIRTATNHRKRVLH